MSNYKVEEGGLTRVLKHARRSEYAMLTAWRGKLSNNENNRRMRQIQGDLSTMRYGYQTMTGVGQEHGGKSYEKSLMVINDQDRPHFYDVMMDLASRYDQDFIIYGKDGISYLIDVNTGERVQKFTGVEPGPAEFFSAVKGAKGKSPKAFHLREKQKETMKKMKKMLKRFETFSVNENDLWKDNPNKNFVELIELYCEELINADLLPDKSAAKLNDAMKAFHESINDWYVVIRNLNDADLLPDDPSMPSGNDVLEVFMRNFSSLE